MLTKIDSLNKELADILAKEGLTIENINNNNDLLLFHPDFDKIIDIILCIEECNEYRSK